MGQTINGCYLLHNGCTWLYLAISQASTLACNICNAAVPTTTVTQLLLPAITA
ncbi:hypothetical protein H6F74_05170 [Trichocoleus sp. FACHB-90]|uniref:hypothetical protein n=1 Tax=Cyanophyceae TaxID=3028117 RepID=UPI001684D9B9|nr:hypothetical protein [Trichocoleus sp. FACHB-90]MBD1925676.1 hypothetical protein [Trichocoleus sp. FACHB-90]